MFPRKSIIAGLLLASSATALPAFAHGPRGGGPFPSEYDANGDGTVTSEEIQAARAEEFAKIDANGDGYISLAELQAWPAKRQEEKFASLDADGSGSLSQAEFLGDKTGRAATLGAKVFKLADANGDGALSLDEFKALAPPEGGRELFHFAALDTDDDGKISAAEYTAAPAFGPFGGRGRHGR
jgi:hypothetical protein